MLTHSVTLDGIQMPQPAANHQMSGAAVLDAVLAMADRALAQLRQQTDRPVAAVGRLRGTGRGIHFGDMIRQLETEHPIKLAAPFEDSELVAGAAWESSSIPGVRSTGALAKLRWSPKADDLPMHVHEHSDRFIIVHEGRGFFHVSNQSADRFDGSDVRSIPARERDVFLFTRGVVHTFSTLDHPMTLLSCQLPFLAFDDPRQYRLPDFRWIARQQPERVSPTVACDPAWSVISLQNKPVSTRTKHI